MLGGVRFLLVLLASLLLAAPAMAQEPQAPTVGPGQVITDQATETEDDASDVPYADDGQPAPEPEPDASGRRGEVHVLDAVSSSSPSSAAATAPTTQPARAERAATGTRQGATLPFTGVDAWQLALIGSALLASGLVARRQLA